MLRVGSPSGWRDQGRVGVTPGEPHPSDSADCGAIADTFVAASLAVLAGGAESRAGQRACHKSADHRRSAKQCRSAGNATAC